MSKTLQILASLLFVGSLLFSLSGAVPTRAEATVVNPGFEEDNDVTTSPAGWTVTGTPGTSYTEWGGHSGSWRLSN